MKHIITVLALFTIVSLAGCATNKDLEAVRALAQQADATANTALATAQSAENTAQEAKATADAAENRIERMAKKNQTTKHK